MMNSSASRALAIPPMPTIGIFTARRHSYTIRTAIGRIAGPLKPPTMFESFGRRVSTSMAMALLEEQSLDRNPAERREVECLRVLDAVSKTAAGRDEGVREAKRSN